MESWRRPGTAVRSPPWLSVSSQCLRMIAGIEGGEANSFSRKIVGASDAVVMELGTQRAGEEAERHAEPSLAARKSLSAGKALRLETRTWGGVWGCGPCLANGA